MPKQVLEQTSRVKICFLLDKSFQRLDFKQIQEARNYNELEEFIQFQTTVQIPNKLLNSDMPIYYYYYTSQMNDSNEIVENLLLELKQIRHLSIINEKKRLYLRYDGFALFKDIGYKSNHDELKQVKEKIFGIYLHMDCLRNESIKELHNDFIEKLVSFYDSLCMTDDEYRTIFENVKIEYFNIKNFY